MKNFACCKHPLEWGIMQNQMVPGQESTGVFENVPFEFFQKLPCNSCTMWTHIIVEEDDALLQ